MGKHSWLQCAASLLCSLEINKILWGCGLATQILTYQQLQALQYCLTWWCLGVQGVPSSVRHSAARRRDWRCQNDKELTLSVFSREWWYLWRLWAAGGSFTNKGSKCWWDIPTISSFNAQGMGCTMLTRGRNFCKLRGVIWHVVLSLLFSRPNLALHMHCGNVESHCVNHGSCCSM